MSSANLIKKEGETQSIPGAHEWDMISGFVLSLGIGKTGSNNCLLVPLIDALKPFELEESSLCEISQAVEHVGEDLRRMCQEGKLDCVNVRVYVTHKMQRRQSASDRGKLKFFLNKQIASSESDNLEAFDNPCCYIDLYVYQVDG